MSVSLSFPREESYIASLSLDFGDLNLLTPTAVRELASTIQSIPDDVAILILEAKPQDNHADSTRGLTAGLDLRWAHERSPHEGYDFLELLYETIQQLRNLPVVTVCNCGEYAIGAGLELAMACDFRIATKNAKLGLPEIDVGIPTVIHGGLLIPLVGLQTATELIFTGKLISGVEAESIALVNEAPPQNEIETSVTELIDTLAEKSPSVLKQQVKVMHHFRSMGLEAGMQSSSAEISRSFGTDDQQEAMKAFLEDRDPSFSGS